ncbi:hypothetical protein Tco_0655337 [Tanacetum coccineum]|uniref:Reverse transcriptase domain-containing protein n=1 Tax=Tanacetum coccineum TaxID=301880 RepID=A0ABQ4X5Q7_9ASTR
MGDKEGNVALGDRIKNIEGKGMRSGTLRTALRGMSLNQPGMYVTSADGSVRQVDNLSNPTSAGIRSCSDEIFGGATSGSQHGPTNKNGNSFASVLQANTNKKIVKIKELRNEVVVEGAAVAIPFEAVQEVKSRFSNTLYGFFIGKRLAFPLVENYVKNTWAKYGLKRTQLHDEFFLFQFESKEGMNRVLEDGPWLIRTVPLILNVWSPNTYLKKAEVKKAPVWIKLHHVPIVAYSEIGLSLITTQLGKPITLDSYTSSMCLNSWGKSTYARALIEVSAEKDLLDSLVIVIPVDNGIWHTLATIDVEYEWNPPRCATCLVFDHHSDKCPKLPKAAPVENVEDDGFVEVKKKKHNMSHIKDSNLQRLCSLVFRHWDWTSNGAWCNKGTRIIMGWNCNDVDVVVIDQNDQVMHTRIWLKKDRKEVFCSFVYAHNKYTDRRSLWMSLCKHTSYIRKRPWSIMGDFNASLFIDESTACSSKVDIAMREFRDCVDVMEMLDVQCTGLQFTWNQKPQGGIGVPFAAVPLYSSLKWSKYISGFHMYRIVKKLKNLKSPLRKLLYDKGNLHVNVNRLRADLDAIQASIDADPFNIALRDSETVCIREFNQAVLLEERFLKQKAKIQWLKEGDSNSAYFHKMVKSRVSRSRIDVVTDVEGIIYENESIPNAFVTHYENFLGQADETGAFNSVNLFKDAMFSMGDDKSPGPDGFTAAFFKEAWSIIENDVSFAVREFFRNGTLLKELNHTIIALIPKVKMPTRVNDYRPISCCNVLFKCISKIIANRIKHGLKTIVSPNQSAFVPGRSITDNILLTQELMHNYHLDRGSPRCAFKVDIQKAYDTVDWSFLRMVLLGFGFHDKMVNWIMECVTTTSYSICINGTLHGYFKGKRGLRQGDPLSPYLFTLVMEVLTLMLQRKVQLSDGFTYHRFCSKMELINLCFADDLFLFAYGDVESASVIKEALDEFKVASGLVPSLPKSTTYFCNVLNHVKLSILHVLPFEEGRLPVRYLGVLLVSSRLMVRDCNELIDRVQIRFTCFCALIRRNKALSIAGRLSNLIQSILGSYAHLWASVLKYKG